MNIVSLVQTTFYLTWLDRHIMLRKLPPELSNISHCPQQHVPSSPAMFRVELTTISCKQEYPFENGVNLHTRLSA